MSRLDGEDSEGKVKVHWFVEDQLKKEMREDAKKQCADAYISLGKCTEKKLISILWSCDKEKKNLSSCLESLATDAELERRKREWIEAHELKY